MQHEVIAVAVGSRARSGSWHESIGMGLGKRLLAAGATAAASELLIGGLEGTLAVVQLPETFVGVVIIAIVGNAAEHSTALVFGSRGDMDVALGIAWESSKQIALLVAPVLVYVGLLVG